MALTPFRWVALAAIGCMLAIVGVVSVAPTRPDPTWYANPSVTDSTDKALAEVAGGLNQMAQNLAIRYRQLYLMDSARRVAGRMPDTGALRVFIAGEYTPAARSAIDRSVRDARSIRAGDAGRVDLFIIADTVHAIRGVRRWSVFPNVRYEMPARAGDRCRVYVTTGDPSLIVTSFKSEKAAEQMLGPCGYYLAFGEPGPLVGKWLMDGGWQFALEGSWTAASFIPQLRDDPSIFKGPSPATQFLDVQSGGAECIKGDLERCEYSLTVSPRRVRSAYRLPGVTPPFSLGRRRYYAGLIGYQAAEVMSDAVRELGRERFKSFWTSPDSVPAAYQKASGERWGAFIQRWMVTHYGEVHPGPRMSAFQVTTSAILVVLAIVATMLISVRRTYS